MLPLWVGLAHGADPAVGARLAGLGGCAACHTAEDGEAYAGGHAIETRFGTFHGTNLTPDPAHGLAGWTLDDFVRAMRQGRSPHGALWPAFPYPSFGAMTDDDLAHVWAFLQGLAPVPRPEIPHDLGPGRVGLWAWRTFLFSPERSWEPVSDDPALDRGAYLVRAVGHCGECHTPRTRYGRAERGAELAGSDEPPYPAPNVTPAGEGTAGWTVSDWVTFFEMGMTPDGDFVGRGMRHVIRDGTAKLDDADRFAMARWMVEGVAPVARAEPRQSGESSASK